MNKTPRKTATATHPLLVKDNAPQVDRNLVFIGGRRTGKTSISMRVKKYSREFTLLSTDALIRCAYNGLTIAEIIDKVGWRRFRETEYEVVCNVARFPHSTVIDAGGGVVVDLDRKGNEIYSKRKVKKLKKHGLIVYLRRSPDEIAAKACDRDDRPQLAADREFLEIMRRREPWYLKAADHVIDCAGKTKKQICEEALLWFYGRAAVGRGTTAR